jgi:OOP family OmpA-OmpF porin|tara:strand:+ start:30776 stop:31993 length:1218 start_codon:yes stop_codon:yes gene_type:complete
MMKPTFSLIITMLCLFLTTSVSAQVKDFNRFSIDGSIGANKVIAPKSPGYSYTYFGILHGDLGVRYMANSKFGVKLEASIDRFKGTMETIDPVGTSESRGRLIKGSLQLVANLGRIANFEDWTKTISLLGHAGPAIGFIKDASDSPIAGTDRVGGLVIGISPIFKLGNNLAITTDLSVIGTFSQQRTYDFKAKSSVLGFDGYYGTASIGISLYLGKKSSHIDWKFEDDEALKKRLDALEAELENTKGDVDLLNQEIKAVQAKMMDDDNDGVANYLDIEPDTKEGAIVNTKGQEVLTPKFDDLMINDPNQGLFYTVQLGVFANMIPEKYWKDITPMYKLKIEDGTTRYYSGIFHSVEEAKVKLDQAKKNGLTDAFITSYYRGQRITVAEADLILSTRGESALRPKP